MEYDVAFQMQISLEQQITSWTLREHTENTRQLREIQKHLVLV
jgi:hypothetical protein